MFKPFIWIVSLFAAAAVFAQEPSPAEILRKADEARGNIAGQGGAMGRHADYHARR